MYAAHNRCQFNIIEQEGEIRAAVSNDTQVIDKGNLVEYTAGEPGKIKSEFFPLVRYRCSSGNFSRGAGAFEFKKHRRASSIGKNFHFKAIVGAKINRSAQCQGATAKNFSCRFDHLAYLSAGVNAGRLRIINHSGYPAPKIRPWVGEGRRFEIDGQLYAFCGRCEFNVIEKKGEVRAPISNSSQFVNEDDGIVFDRSESRKAIGYFFPLIRYRGGGKEIPRRRPTWAFQF